VHVASKKASSTKDTKSTKNGVQAKGTILAMNAGVSTRMPGITPFMQGVFVSFVLFVDSA